MAGVIDRLPVASPALVTEHAKKLVANSDAHLLVLRAQPRWTGSDELTVGDHRVLVRTAVSQLAALAALAERRGDDYLILLSDRTDQELGDAVILRAHRQRVESVDEWSTIAALYDAQLLDPALPRFGSWVAAALLGHRPPEGWPLVATGVVTADHALGNLLGACLRLPLPVELDLVGLISALDTPTHRAGWQATAETLRGELQKWAVSSLGAAAGMALAAAARGPISIVATGLALDVLWPSTGGDVAGLEQGPARGRVESRIDGRPVSPGAARTLADAARTQLLRLDLDLDPTVPGVLAQAEALLADLGWPAGAERSTVLPSGLRARHRVLASLLAEPTPRGLAEKLPQIEEALADVVQHDRAAPHEADVIAARMVVRLARWAGSLSGRTLPTELGAALHDYLADGAWVDRAVAIAWNGSADAVVSAAYRSLLVTVRRLRADRDQNAAQLLVNATLRDEAPAGAVFIENALGDVVWPIAAATRPLVILLDGMSVPVALELAEALSGDGWVERVPDAARRVPLLAALPTLTRYSRTAFFTGELRDGTQDTETAALKARFGAPLFHKGDLRSDGGESLPSPVRAAIHDPNQRLIAVVLNTIDDALDKHDPGGTRWDLGNIQNLRALLAAAAEAGRTVVLTSDHGHVVERGSEVRPSAGGEARRRPLSSGPPASDEVLVRGRRVVSSDDVLPWREDLRYTSIRSGYHGGASLAEITVPFLVFGRTGQVPPNGWRDAPPPAPAWWNETARVADPVMRQTRDGDPPAGRIARTPAPRVVRPGPDDGPQGVLAFDVPGASSPSRTRGDGVEGAAAPASVASLVEQLTESETYRHQRARAGRHALAHDQVAVALTTLLDGGGRVHRDTLASALDISATSLGNVFAAIGRLLNVDSYPVIALDSDGVTVRLDESLLCEQFELGTARG